MSFDPFLIKKHRLVVIERERDYQIALLELEEVKSNLIKRSKNHFIDVEFCNLMVAQKQNQVDFASYHLNKAVKNLEEESSRLKQESSRLK